MPQITYICKKLSNKIILNRLNYSVMYELKCNNFNSSYVGQTGSSIVVRHKEHTRYIKTNNPVSAYALHILNNKYEYGNAEENLTL